MRKLERTRRDVLKTGALALGSAALSIGRDPRPAAAGTIRVASPAIDAHVHVWTPDVERYPLAAGYSVEQMKPRSFTPQELLRHAKPAGVERIVLIQMSYYGSDNRYMLDTMKAHPGVFSGVAVIDEHAARVGQTMRELKKQGVRGFRIHPGKQPVDTWLASQGMAAMWNAAADEQLAICALVDPDALEPLDAMCRQYPRTRLVVDHFGRIGLDGTIRPADVDNLCRLARHANTYVKVSAFYALGKKRAPYTDLAPMIRRVVDAYEPRRLMWASDCPYQVQDGHTYGDSIELVRSRLDFLSADDRNWLLRKTAEQVYFG